MPLLTQPFTPTHTPWLGPCGCVSSTYVPRSLTKNMFTRSVLIPDGTGTLMQHACKLHRGGWKNLWFWRVPQQHNTFVDSLKQTQLLPVLEANLHLTFLSLVKRRSTWSEWFTSWCHKCSIRTKENPHSQIIMKLPACQCAWSSWRRARWAASMQITERTLWPSGLIYESVLRKNGNHKETLGDQDLCLFVV